MTPSDAPITIRRAREDDRETAARIIADPPGDEAVGFCGDPEKARRIGIELGRMGVSLHIEHTFVAEIDGRTVAVMESGPHGEPSVSIGAILRILPVALRIGGPVWTGRTILRQRLRSSVDFSLPARAYHIAELDVDTAYRNRGIGGGLLRHAETDACNTGLARMSLTTSMTNPARRLYERNGYRVVEEKTDAA
jgi:ribosomal protein S18 acetylase RimI-like enzyme